MVSAYRYTVSISIKIHYLHHITDYLYKVDHANNSLNVRCHNPSYSDNGTYNSNKKISGCPINDAYEYSMPFSFSSHYKYYE